MNDYFDWRLHGVDYAHQVSPSEIRISASGPIEIEMVDPVPLPGGRTLALPIPNATAMLLHASKRAYDDAQKLLSKEMYKINPRDVVKMNSNAEAVDVVEYLILSIFAAYTALECFANEWIPPWVNFRKADRKDGYRILEKEEMERQLSLKTKLDYVLPRVFKVASPMGNHIWESFVKLEAARNRVVHMKQADRESANVGIDTVWKMLFQLPAPHLTAKGLVDWFMAEAPHIPGLAYDKLLPVRPRWHVKYPSI